MAGPALRFAFQRLAKPVANLFKNQNGMDLAMRFGPDFGYAAMAGGLFAPEDATMGERAAMMGEDLVMGVGSSIVGQGIGRGIGRRRAAGAMKGQPKTPETRAQYRNTVNNWQTGGDVLGQMGMVMLPRPVSQGVYEASAERNNQSVEQMQADQQDALEQELLLAAALGIGVPAAGKAAQHLTPPSVASHAVPVSTSAMNLTA